MGDHFLCDAVCTCVPVSRLYSYPEPSDHWWSGKLSDCCMCVRARAVTDKACQLLDEMRVRDTYFCEYNLHPPQTRPWPMLSLVRAVFVSLHKPWSRDNEPSYTVTCRGLGWTRSIGPVVSHWSDWHSSTHVENVLYNIFWRSRIFSLFLPMHWLCGYQ